MNCEHIEQNIATLFIGWSESLLKAAVKTKDFSEFPNTEVSNHLSECSDCQATLTEYLLLRDRIKFEAHPCFHLATCELDSDGDVKFEHGFYLIPTAKGNAYRYIKYCPWCGVKVPKVYRDLSDIYCK